MKLKPLTENKTELTVTNKQGNRVRILFSYQTPVACDILTNCGTEFYKTEVYYSKTTTKHIKSWLPYEDAETVEQEWFDRLLDEVK